MGQYDDIRDAAEHKLRTWSREDFVRERLADEEAWVRHECYEPLGLLSPDRVRVVLSQDTKETLERCLPELAETLWAVAERNAVLMASGLRMDSQFLSWCGPSDPGYFSWGILGEYVGLGKFEVGEEPGSGKPCPFDCDMLQVFGYGYVRPGDVTHANRMMGFGLNGSGYEEVG